MLVFERQYQNLLGESIRLDIYRFTNCCHLIITRNRRSNRWYFLWCLGSIAFLILISFIFSFNFNKIFDRITVILLTIILIVVLFYWRSPVQQESLIILDNVNGIETTKRNIFGKKHSYFITTNHIIINEAITMHRVIYYLVAIPPSLSSILSDSNDTNSKSDSGMRPKPKPNRVTNDSYDSNLIPLFCNTCPRLDCLKVMYQHIQLFKSMQNRAKHREIIDGKLFNSRIKSFVSNPLSIKRRNGFKSEIIDSKFVSSAK